MMNRRAWTVISALIARLGFLLAGLVQGMEELPTVPWEMRQATLGNSLKILLLQDTRALANMDKGQM